jgi:protein SCO1/2
MRSATYLRAIAACLVFAATARAAEVSGDGVRQLTAPMAIADFTLTDQDGKPFHFRQLKGRPVLLFFGFTRCPDACPTALTQMTAVARRADPGLRATRVVMVSIDGERDSPALMKRYVAGLSPGVIGLTGDPKSVATIAAQFSAVFFKGLPYDRAGNYLVQHTTQIYLLDRSGRLRSAFTNAATDRIADLTRIVAREKS